MQGPYANLELLLDVLQKRLAGALVMCKARLPQPHTCSCDALRAKRRGAAFELVHQLINVVEVDATGAADCSSVMARQLDRELVQLAAGVLKVQLHHLRMHASSAVHACDTVVLQLA
jgi:hypothetical protein